MACLDTAGFVMSEANILAYDCLYSKKSTNCFTSSHHWPRPLPPDNCLHRTRVLCCVKKQTECIIITDTVHTEYRMQMPV